MRGSTSGELLHPFPTGVVVREHAAGALACLPGRRAERSRGVELPLVVVLSAHGRPPLALPVCAAAQAYRMQRV
jgi:hypothetical protein